MIAIEKPGTPEEIVLEHHGVKGQRWGVRKAYSTRLAGMAARDRRVATGTGSGRDKLATALTTSNYAVVRRGGLKNAAAFRADKREAHAKRLANGEATTLDVLKLAGGVRISDLARANKRS